jgi:hypothetical protein
VVIGSETHSVLELPPRRSSTAGADWVREKLAGGLHDGGVPFYDELPSDQRLGDPSSSPI